MKSLACLVGLVAAGVIAVGSTAPLGQSASRPQRVLATSGSSAPVERAGEQAALDAWDRTVTAWTATGRLVTTRRQADPLLPGRVHERFDEFYQGIPVFGGGVSRQLDATGRAVSVFGTVHPDIVLEIAPGIGSPAAAARLAAAGGGPVQADDGVGLMVLPTATGYRLTWKARVISLVDGRERRIFIDATTGSTILSYDDTWTQVRTEGDVGVGTGILGDRLKLSVEKTSNGYLAIDRLRRGSTTTYDMRNDPYRTRDVHTNISQPGTAEIAQDPDNVWTDGNVVSAHAYAGLSLDYLRQVHGLIGLDGINSPISLFTNLADPNDAGSLGMQFPLYFNNAFYSNRRAFFGVGNGSTNRNFAALDVVAHELAHGVTAFSSGLIYLYESGALNEAFSDIIGVATEHQWQRTGSSLAQGDWLLGEDVRIGGGAIRSMPDPRAFGHPDHYSIRYTGTSDNGGVHINSSIANHAFYLAIVGGRHRLGAFVEGVGFDLRHEIERIFFRAFTGLLTRSATFREARAATIQSARDLYGAGGSQETAIIQAWNAVGVQ
jgi:thermolysin